MQLDSNSIESLVKYLGTMKLNQILLESQVNDLKSQLSTMKEMLDSTVTEKNNLLEELTILRSTDKGL